MNNTEIVNASIPSPVSCLWQMTPAELPKLPNPFALEMWADEDGNLHLFQFFVGKETKQPWYSRINHHIHFVQAPAKQPA